MGTASPDTPKMFSMFSERGHELRVYEGYKFYKDRITQLGQKWRCVKKSCPVSLYVNTDGTVYVNGLHEHLPGPVHRQYINNNAKMAVKETLEATNIVIAEELKRMPKEIQHESLTKTDLELLKHNMGSTKRKLKLTKRRDLSEEASLITDVVKKSPLEIQADALTRGDFKMLKNNLALTLKKLKTKMGSRKRGAVVVDSEVRLQPQVSLQYAEPRLVALHNHEPHGGHLEAEELRKQMRLQAALTSESCMDLVTAAMFYASEDAKVASGRIATIKRDIRRTRQLMRLKEAENTLNRMHVMEGEGDKVGEMVAESAPELVTAAKTTDINLSTKEALSLPAQDKIQEPEIQSLPEQTIKSAADSTPSENEEKDKTETPSFLVNGDSNADVNTVSGSEKNGEVNADTSKADESEDVCMGNGSAEGRTKENEKEDAKETVKEGLIPVVVVEVKENGSGAVSEEEDRQSVTSSQGRKRAALPEGEAEVENEGSSSESDGGANKRPRMENDDGEDERERLVREYVDECTESMDEMNRAADKLQREIGALGELLRTKELEWNSILRLRKLKEEMLERLLRRRRLSAMMTENGVREEYIVDKEREKMKNTKVINLNTTPMNGPTQLNNGSLMMVPVVSSSPSPSPGPPPRSLPPSSQQLHRGPPRGPMQRPILPKPPHPHDPVGEGRQGAILDVKSIIADYRSRHPQDVPRRGRRMRPHEGGPGGLMRGMMDTQGPVVSSTRISGSPALMSMANMALGSGSHVRENPNAPPFIGGGEGSRPSSADSSRSAHHLEMLPAPSVSFKDALVQFAKMSQPPKAPPPPPPPYPEVTLHPVSPPPPPPPPPQHSQSHSSLLHNILTKSQANSMMAAVPPQPHRATTFSPTLARLLTAPERGAPVPPTPHFRPRVNITDILSSSKKNRNEITITPVAGSNKTKEDVVMLQDDEEEGDGDRLVIDEGRDTGASSGANPTAGRELPENVPECQGCHQRSAQFVCAGCGNQWYCSRECQVTAWEEHSEMCSG